MAKRGRPSSFTQAIADEICERLGNGEPLAQICRDEAMPALRTVYDWQIARELFSAAIARARDAGYDHIAARLRQTARGKTVEDGGDSSGDIQRDKLIVDTDLRLLSKWDARRYGDKLDVTSGGEKLSPEIGETERVMRIASILNRNADPDRS